MQCSKYFTVYPLLDIKALRSATKNAWLEPATVFHVCALAGSLAEVMEFSIRRGTLFVCGWVISEVCSECGYVPNPPAV